VVELTIVRFAIFFDLDYSFFGVAEVIWIFGVSMIVMAGLVWLPTAAVAVFGLVLIAGHNLLDTFAVQPATAMAGNPPLNFGQTIWLFLHQPGFVPLFGAASKMFVAYPLLPWIGVMAAGYALGSIYGWESKQRRKLLFRLGAVAVVLFAILRSINIYGDPSPWQPQSDRWFTVLSFLNCTKYPGSLDFLLMTLGPALLVLAWFDWLTFKPGNPLVVFGRVPMFYYLLHIYIFHALAVVAAMIDGHPASDMVSLGTWVTANAQLKGYGFNLWVVYGVWIAVVVALYPLCKWFAGYKRDHQAEKKWLSYL